MSPGTTGSAAPPGTGGSAAPQVAPAGAGRPGPVEWGVSDLCLHFGGVCALDHVSLRLPAGQVRAVVGGDGAGKTTLLRVLAGALAPGSGRVHHPRASRTGYLAASSGTYPDLSVAENLEFAATAYRVPPAAARDRTRDYLQRTGLAPVTGRLAGNLSGGMRQKLGVIRAMVHRPDLLVLDEPTTGVDPVSRADLWWLIARAAAEGAAVVLSTTYLDEAERATRVLLLDRGRSLVEGTPQEIVAAMPGALGRSATRPGGADARLAWRRGAAWRVWYPDGLPAGADRADPDLQDAVTVAALAEEVSR
jgi:ABC-type multidrug transport system ATPase subunit